MASQRVRYAPYATASSVAPATRPTAGSEEPSEIIPVPPELNEWFRGPRFQQILLKVKEQTGVNYFTLHNEPKDGSASLWIFATRLESAKMARLLIDVNFKQQMKLSFAEFHLRQMQNDLSSVQSELITGTRIEFTVPAQLIGLMIGKKGYRVQEIINNTGVRDISVDGNACRVTIVGDDAGAVQSARAAFELFEDFTPLSDEECNQLQRDVSTLMEFKTTSDLVLVKLEFNPSRIAYVGTRSALSTAKIVLQTQLEYINKRVELLKDEKFIRSELYTYKKNRYSVGNGDGQNDDRRLSNSSNVDSAASGRNNISNAESAMAKRAGQQKNNPPHINNQGNVKVQSPALATKTTRETRSAPQNSRPTAQIPASDRGPSIRDSLQNLSGVSEAKREQSAGLRTAAAASAAASAQRAEVKAPVENTTPPVQSSRRRPNSQAIESLMSNLSVSDKKETNASVAAVSNSQIKPAEAVVEEKPVAVIKTKGPKPTSKIGKNSAKAATNDFVNEPVTPAAVAVVVAAPLAAEVTKAPPAKKGPKPKKALPDADPVKTVDAPVVYSAPVPPAAAAVASSEPPLPKRTSARNAAKKISTEHSEENPKK